jgi:hypothetical protein
VSDQRAKQRRLTKLAQEVQAQLPADQVFIVAVRGGELNTVHVVADPVTVADKLLLWHAIVQMCGELARRVAHESPAATAAARLPQ